MSIPFPRLGTEISVENVLFNRVIEAFNDYQRAGIGSPAESVARERYDAARNIYIAYIKLVPGTSEPE